MAVKKLIEVALPLEKINEASAREKSIRHGHPSTLHLWWARRPLATARAVIFSSLVDDPSAHPEKFKTEKAQARERKRLFKLIEKMVQWENSGDKALFAEAYEEIKKSTGGDPPPLFDPFAGGGAIPLEAQRLGLKAIAADLNPVAVMINKAMIEIPPRFAGMAPVNPAAPQAPAKEWTGAQGLAEDVRYYGEWMKQEAFKRIGHLYPKVKVPAEQGGGEATVIAWIWTRTVKCPNPACGCTMPLASSFVLSKKKGNEAFVVPHFDYRKKIITYHVHTGSGLAPKSGKISRGAKFKCIMCHETVSDDYIKQESSAGRLGSELMAIVAEGQRGRIYISPSEEQARVAVCSKPNDYPDQPLPYDPRNIWCVNYGLDTYDKLFTNRQLTALTTFSDLVVEAQKKAGADAVNAGLPDDQISLEAGGKGALAYGQAVSVYLALLVDKLADRGSIICVWDHSPDGLTIRNTFGRQAIPMAWDYAEANPFSKSSGSINHLLDLVSNCIEKFLTGKVAKSFQHDAAECNTLEKMAVSIDPPYYDNISYAALSDFFYVWMRRSLKDIYPKLFCTILVPKSEELIATPYRHDGNLEKAKCFFENGMMKVFYSLYNNVRHDIPLTVYYAYKQSGSNNDKEEKALSGWETMLSAIIKSGFTITGTWPMRTEMANRSIASGTNALASSIVLVCRKRPQDAPVGTRRNFINELKRELRPALQKLQESNIAPVDLAQSAIGPGMGVYSRYARVLEADGAPMTVRDALKIINQELDLYFNEQDGELDSESRFCVSLFSQAAFREMPFGDANTLATAKNTSVAVMAAHGILYAQKGKVHLVERPALPEKIQANENRIWLLCQQLTCRMEKKGVEGCAEAVADMLGSNAERAKDLAYRLYTIAERKKWAQEAYAYNALVVAWPEIQSRAAELKAAKPEQLSIFDESGEGAS